MASRFHCLTLVFAAAFCNRAVAQNLPFSCLAPGDFQTLSLTQVESRLGAGQKDFYLYKRQLDLTPLDPRPGRFARFYLRLLEQHRDDPRYVYLYGKALIGKDTPQAIVELSGVTKAAPQMPWTYAALAQIYSSRNFSDSRKLNDNIREYQKLCPENIDAYLYLDKLRDLGDTAAAARQLRELLTKADTVDNAPYWKTLWAAEFRVAPDSIYDQLRKRVQDDLRKLSSRPKPWNRNLKFAILEGYNLTGQKALAEALERELDADGEVIKVYRAWEDKYQMRTSRLTREQSRLADAELAELSEAWIRKWPTSAIAWQQYMGNSINRPDWKAEEIEHAGEEILKIDKANPMAWNYTPKSLRVAQSWIRLDIRPAECLRLAESALEQISLGPEEANDLTAVPDQARLLAARSFGFDVALWDAMGAVTDASIKLQNTSRASAMVDRMRTWVNQNQLKKDDPTTGFMDFESRYLRYAGKLAEARGQRVDAVAYYVRAMSLGWTSPDDVKHIRTLWGEVGGSDDAWDYATQRLPMPQPKTPASPPTVASATPTSSAGKPLPHMDLRDITGKHWTLENLRGKTTFVNLWATWCVPCREELPYVEKLHEQLKDRKDVQLITLNLDENPGQLDPFLKPHPYAFPIILSRQYVEDFIGQYTIPQNWIVDANGIQKTLPFEQPNNDWPKKMLEKLK